jgi:hypothetical protein
LPVRSTGPDTSDPSREDPECVSQRPGGFDRRERPQAARGLEQRRRLQLAAPQIALDRDVGGVCILALQQLAGCERRARVRERAQLRGVLVARQLGERAREEQIPGRDCDLASGHGRHRGAPTPQPRTVDQVVVDERRRVDELHSDGRSHEPCLALEGVRGSAGRLGRENHEQRAQPLAARHDRGVRMGCQRRAGLRCDLLEVQLGAGHALAERAAAAAHDRVEPVHAPLRSDGSRAAHCAHHALSAGTVPAWIATIPPAVSR